MTDDGNHGGATAQEATAAFFACDALSSSCVTPLLSSLQYIYIQLFSFVCSYSNQPLLLSRPPPPTPPATDEATLPPGHHAHAMVNQIGGKSHHVRI